MGKLLELAEVDPSRTVLEVGPGTGSLTEELLTRAGRVVAVEIDSGLCQLLAERFGDRGTLKLLCCDALAGKHHLAGEMLASLGDEADLVANLPYNLATPLLAECLISTWRALRGGGGCRFGRLTFTVQREVAERLSAAPGCADYGPLAVLVALLGKLRLGAGVPATAFWPRPKIASRMVRIDFDPAAATRLVDVGRLQALLATAFGQRRKQIGSIIRRKQQHFSPQAIEAALTAARIDRSLRPQDIPPDQYLSMADALGQQGSP